MMRSILAFVAAVVASAMISGCVVHEDGHRHHSKSQQSAHKTHKRHHKTPPPPPPAPKPVVVRPAPVRR